LEGAFESWSLTNLMTCWMPPGRVSNLSFKSPCEVWAGSLWGLAASGCDACLVHFQKSLSGMWYPNVCSLYSWSDRSRRTSGIRSKVAMISKHNLRLAFFLSVAVPSPEWTPLLRGPDDCLPWRWLTIVSLPLSRLSWLALHWARPPPPGHPPPLGVDYGANLNVWRVS
jgi:hypothetical protein